MRRTTILLLLLFALGLSGCGSASTPAPTPDVALIMTQAVYTVSVQLTQTAQALTASAPTSTPTTEPSPTPTASPTWTPIATLSIGTFPAETPTPGAFFGLTPTPPVLQPPIATPTGPLCNDLAWVTDIGLPDGSVVKPETVFKKGWLVKNTGICKWETGYHLVQVGGNTNFGGATFVIRTPQQEVKPGEIAEISLTLVAPKQPGKYEAHYQMYSHQQVPFGSLLSIFVEVRR